MTTEMNKESLELTVDNLFKDNFHDLSDKVAEKMKPYLELQEMLKEYEETVTNLIHDGSIEQINEFLDEHILNKSNKKAERFAILCNTVGSHLKDVHGLKMNMINLLVKKTYEYMKSNFNHPDYYYKVELMETYFGNKAMVKLLSKKTKTEVIALDLVLNNVYVKIDYNQLTINDTEMVKQKINHVLTDLFKKFEGVHFTDVIPHKTSAVYKGQLIQLKDYSSCDFIEKELDSELECVLVSKKYVLITPNALKKLKEKFPNIEYTTITERMKFRYLPNGSQKESYYFKINETDYTFFTKGNFTIKGNYPNLSKLGNIVEKYAILM